MSAPKAVFIALVALAVAQAIFYYPQLPGTMASHFDGAGHPNGWSSKPVFVGGMFGMMALMADAIEPDMKRSVLGYSSFGSCRMNV